MLKSEGKRPRPNTFGEPRVKTNRERGDEHERITAKIVGGRAQPNSGAGDFLSVKGDVQSDDFLYQCKVTDKSRFTITSRVIGEVYRQASLTDRACALVIKMEAMPEPLPQEWVCVPMSVWREIIGS